MEIEAFKVEPLKYFDMIELMRQGIGGERPSKEILVRDWNPGDPDDKALIYTVGKKVAVLPVMPQLIAHRLSSFYVVGGAPEGESGVDYAAAYQFLMKEVFGKDVGSGIVVRRGEKGSIPLLYSGISFHEGPFSEPFSFI
jgi:hypothetical protein